MHQNSDSSALTSTPGNSTNLKHYYRKLTITPEKQVKRNFLKSWLMTQRTAMTIGATLIVAVRRRVAQIERELDISTVQLEMVENLECFKKESLNALLFERGICLALHDLYCEYLRDISTEVDADSSFKKVVQTHLRVMRSVGVESLLAVIEGHRAAFGRLTSTDDVREEDRSGFNTVKDALAWYLPYESLVIALMEPVFVEALFTIVVEYKMERHVIALQSLCKFLENLDQLEGDRYLTVAMAELILLFFVEGRIEKTFEEPDKTFAFIQNSWILTRNGVKSFGIENVPSQLTPLGYTRTGPRPLEVTWKRYCESWPQKDQQIISKICPGVEHVILELRKMEIQISPCMMMHRLCRALSWMKMVISTNEKSGNPVGADELFLIFVMAVCEADMPRLPAISKFVEKFMISEFRRASVAYFQTQLRAAVDWVLEHAIAAREKVLLPVQKFGDLEPENPEGVEVRGFHVYAVPRHRTCKVPAFAFFTGEKSNVAVMYEYDLDASDPLLGSLGFWTAPEGKIMKVNMTQIQELDMINVVNGSYERSAPMIDVVSNLMVFLPVAISRPKTMPLDILMDHYSATWHVKATEAEDDMSRQIIAMKERLKQCGRYNGNITGVVDQELISTLKKQFGYTGSDSGFSITEGMFASVMKLRPRGGIAGFFQG